MNSRTPFDEHAANYDAARRQLIPCFDAFYGTAVEVVDAHISRKGATVEVTRAPLVLDLGAGTGLFSAMLLERIAGLRVVLLDASRPMLTQAHTRLGERNPRVSCVAGDFRQPPLALRKQAYDAVVSALAIHHLSASGKRQLFEQVFGLLKPGGVFLNADQVLGPTEWIEARYRAVWQAQVESSGIHPRDRDAALARMEQDRISPLEQQLDWLRTAGFEQVNCWYQNYSFAVFSGVCPSPT